MEQNEMSQRALLYRERRLAEAVLAQYDMAGARLQQIATGFNRVYRVTTEAGKSFVLRASLPHSISHNRGYVASELTLLAALHRDTALPVPEPVANREGGWVTTLTDPLLGDRHHAMFRWMEGKVVGKGVGPTVLRQAGGFLALLHEYTQKLLPPPDFERPSWDWAHVGGLQSWVGKGGSESYLDDEGRAVYTLACERVQAAMQQLDEQQDSFGLLHADLHPWNMLRWQGQLRVLDFEVSGWGHWLLDLAIALNYKLGKPDLAASQAALLDGYAAVRSLPTRCEELLGTFIAARLLCEVNWVADSTEPPTADRVQETVVGQVKWLKVALNL